MAVVGGIGIKASNTDVSTGKPAQTIEQAGQAVTPRPQKISQPQDGNGNSGAGERSKVEIPANCKDLT